MNIKAAALDTVELKAAALIKELIVWFIKAAAFRTVVLKAAALILNFHELALNMINLLI